MKCARRVTLDHVLLILIFSSVFSPLFVTPFSDRLSRLGGGTFDPVSGLICLTVQKADSKQGRYANPPVVVAYSVGTSRGQ